MEKNTNLLINLIKTIRFLTGGSREHLPQWAGPFVCVPAVPGPLADKVDRWETGTYLRARRGNQVVKAATDVIFTPILKGF